MGLALQTPATSTTGSHDRTHKAFLLSNYLLLGAASSCVFLTLSLRLIPSVPGLLLIFLQILTATASIFALTNHSLTSGKAHGAHMVSTVLAAIFQAATAVLIFTRTYEFLVGGLKSYVRVEDGVVILKMIGGLCIVVFCLEWVVLALAFVLRYYDYMERDGGAARRSTARVRCEGGGGEELKDWPWPFQV